MEKHAQVRTDNMSGTIYGNDLVTLRYSGDIDNGNVLAIGTLEAGQREVRTASIPGVATPIADLALVASEEVDKEKSMNSLSEFYNKEGVLIRGYRLRPGIFSITEEALATGSVAATVGVDAMISSNTKIKLGTYVAADPAATTLIGKVIAIEGQWIVIEIK
jgi:hypothetical protein